MKVNVREARQRFSEIINRVSNRGERVVLMSRNKPKAAIVGLKEAEAFEDEPVKKGRRLFHLEQIKKIRHRVANKKIKSNSSYELKKMRESRLEGFRSSH